MRTQRNALVLKVSRISGFFSSKSLLMSFLFFNPDGWLLTFFFPMFPFDHPENIRKPDEEKG